MRACSICGNEIPERVRTCPFCEQPQQQQPGRSGHVGGGSATSRTGRSSRSTRGSGSPRGGVPMINVKVGMPTVAAALQHLQNGLQTQRMVGVRVVRVVHGWGSTGHGGAIGQAVRRELAALHERGSVRSFVAGEDYSELDEAGRGLLERHPSLRSTLGADRLNRGITIVEL
jgi:hypothetical protein